VDEAPCELAGPLRDPYLPVPMRGGQNFPPSALLPAPNSPSPPPVSAGLLPVLVTKPPKLETSVLKAKKLMIAPPP
jgi:hypothetical protein